MSRLTLKLPETLHQQLANLAKEEGISLNQYIVYALTRQVTTAYTVEKISEEKIEQQHDNFNHLIVNLGKADSKEIEAILSQRETANPEAKLTPDIVKALRSKIAKSGN